MMNALMRYRWILLLLVIQPTQRASRGAYSEQVAGVSETPTVKVPNEAVFERFRVNDRDAARTFYKKTIDVNGMPVLASAEVADEALTRTHEIVSHILAGRPDIHEVMVKNGTRLIVIGKNQVYTDMPEYRNHPNPKYQNDRVRGTGGLDVTSFGEENLLTLSSDRYDDESIGVHEFCHTIDAALGRIDSTWRTLLGRTYRDAIGKGLWKNAYAASNPGEYWAEICQSYFNCNRINNWNHNPIGTRELLKQYDPDGYDLVRKTFQLSPQRDWTYKPLRSQPSVEAPPERFHADRYYKKLTLAREFPIFGSSKVSDEALLAANDIVRKMFAYRHDVLKAMIVDGARLVVLGRDERLSDLPEYLASANVPGFDDVRYADYSPDRKLMVVPEENVLGLGSDRFAGKSMVVSVFAKGSYRLTSTRPVDPDFEKRPQKQQYELRVKRLDIEFDRTLQSLLEDAKARGLWRGTAASRDAAEYWAAGVEAYFDAAGDGHAPESASRPVTTRETLKAYDPSLFVFIEETLAYKERVDWRLRKPRLVR